MRILHSAHMASVSIVLSFALGCVTKENPAPHDPGPNPLHTLNKLLEHHDLLGKQPEERSERSKNNPVRRKDLEQLILDLDKFDDFLSNLYVGFIAGAVSRHQTRLYVSKIGNKAIVTAGSARIVLRLAEGAYRISLEESIPPEIAKRALSERAKIESQL